MTNPVLKETVLSLLKMPAIQAIAFTIENLTLTRVHMGMVRNAVASGAISCEVAASSSSGLDSGFVAAASYLATDDNAAPLREAGFAAARANMFVFPSRDYGRTDTQEKCNIVHECAHAAFDALGKPGSPTQISALKNEMAAQLAAAIWYRVSNIVWMGSPIVDGDSFSFALKIADRLAAETRNFQDRRTFVIGMQHPDSVAFRRAVASEWSLTGSRATIVDTIDGI